MPKLVILESPAKAKTIGKYLGRGYKVTASMGHVRDLPASTLGIDVENGYTPKYITIKGKQKLVKELKAEAKKCDGVLLATDPDREGEAISWHLQHLLELPEDKAQRVTFNEITKKVVQDSIQHPRAIDQDLVDAQQARRVLDRIVGYQLSPLLWKKIRRGLSAGRVQSVAIRLVAQREKEIAEFVPQEYWSLDVHLQNKAAAPFTAHYYGVNGKKYEPKDEADTQRIVAELQAQTFSVKTVKRTDKQRSPTPPFTTSSLQQEASRKLNMTPRRTMAIAQQLYEGVDITGEGTVGLITYMRTDSLRISEEAVAAAKEFIVGRYGQQYYPAKGANHYKAKASAQDAHEAIRPSNVNWTPEMLKKDLTGEQYRLYRLVWSRFVACQMANAVYDSVSVEIDAAGHSFRTSSSSLKFSGYTAVYEEGKDDDKEEKEPTLPPLTEGETLDLKSFGRDQHFTQPPAHYTVATLIRAMEEQGIGRPSTYAPTVSTILDREYVVKEGKYLHITNLGRVVTQLMEERFSDIADLKFTANMEKKLDVIADKLEEYGADEDSLRTALLGAQKLGDSVIKESKTKAEIILRDANIKAEKIIGDAHLKADEEQRRLESIKRSVSEFKKDIIALYRGHLETIISTIPEMDVKPEAPEAEAAAEPEEPAVELDRAETAPAPAEAVPDAPENIPDILHQIRSYAVLLCNCVYMQFTIDMDQFQAFAVPYKYVQQEVRPHYCSHLRFPRYRLHISPGFRMLQPYPSALRSPHSGRSQVPTTVSW